MELLHKYFMFHSELPDDQIPILILFIDVYIVI